MNTDNLIQTICYILNIEPLNSSYVDALGAYFNVPNDPTKPYDKQVLIYALVNYSSTIPLPSEVVEVADFASLPATGDSNTIYITLDDNLIYIWNGSGYEEVSPSSNVLGSEVIQNSLTNTTQWSPISNGSASVNAAHTANTLYVAPFTMNSNFLVKKLSFETLGSTGGTIFAGVYAMDSNFLPTGAPLIASTGMTNTTIGLKTYTLPSAYLLQEGVKYGLAILATNVTTTTRSVATKNLLGSLVTSSVQYSCYSAPTFTGLTANPVMTTLDFRTPGVFFSRA